MVAVLRAATRPRLPRARLGSRLLRPAASTAGGAAPTVRSSSTYASTAAETTFNIALPTGWQAGDVCYLAVESRATGATINTPTGFTAVAATFNPVGVTNTAMAVFRRVLQAGDIDPVAVSGASGRFAAVAVAVQSADGTTPEDGVSPAEAPQSAATNSPVADSVTPVSSNDLLLCFFGAGDPTTANVAMTFTQPAGMTLVAQASSALATSTDAGVMAASLALTSSAATGTKTATVTPSSGVVATNSQAVTLVVKAAGVGGTTNGSASVAGAGTLSATATVILAGAASLAGAGSLAAAGITTANGVASPTGAGVLSAAGSVVIPGAATLAGAGALVTSTAPVPVPVGTPTSGSGTAITTTGIPLPTGSAAGDVAVLAVNQVGGQAISSNSLSAIQRGRQIVTGNISALTIFTKVLDATDISTNSVTVTFAASQRYTVGIFVATGAADFDAISAGGSDATAVTAAVVPSVVPASNNTLDVAVIGGRVQTTTTDVTWTWPATLTERLDVVGIGAVQRSYLTIATWPVLAGAGTTQGPDTANTDAGVTVQYAAFRLTIAPPGGAVTGTAALAAAGSLTAGVTQGSSAALTGAGVLSAGATQRAAASPAGAGALTAAGTVIVPGAASLAGAGVLTATVGGVTSGTAALAGAGALTAGATQGSGAALAGAGALSAQATQQAAAAPAGAGALTAAGTIVIPGAASLTGAGALTAQVTQRVTATLTGAGVLAVSAGGASSGTATPAGAGVLTATAAVLVPGTAAFTGAGALTAAATQRINGTATLAGVGAVTAGSLQRINGAAVLAGAGSLTAAGGAVILGGAVLVGAGSVVAVLFVGGPGVMAGVALAVPGMTPATAAVPGMTQAVAPVPAMSSF